MIHKLALKRLTASDLTFFECHFRTLGAGNQKAINLNANIFKDKLYPVIDTVAHQSNGRIGVDLWIGGPAGAEPINLQRKIIKGQTYKNWRLDGELVYDPRDEPRRFGILAPQDLVVFGFEGALAPHTVMLICLARAVDNDGPLVDQLEKLLYGKSMVSLDTQQLRAACEYAVTPPTHPIWKLVTNQDIVDASTGIWPAVARILVRARPSSTPEVTHEELEKGRAIAAEIGKLGERLVDQYLRDLRDSGRIADYEWTANANAIAPFDFRVCLPGTEWEKWEIKTTSGDFGRDYYLPRSELREMAIGGEPYRIGRVYGAHHHRGRLRVSEDLGVFGRAILQGCQGFPNGLGLNGVTIEPADSLFGKPVDLNLPDGLV